jgi:hypothetical protein
MVIKNSITKSDTVGNKQKITRQKITPQKKGMIKNGVVKNGKK